MNKSLPHKTKQFFFVLIKLSIVVGALYFIYQKIVYNDQVLVSEFLDQIEKNILAQPSTIILLLILTGLNWFFEIIKWQVLLNVLKKIAFGQAAKQSLAALTVSLFTPNRIGEYGAKALYFNKRLRPKVMLLNLIGNSMQLFITTLAGGIGLAYFLSTFEISIEFFRFKKLVYILLSLLVFSTLGLRYNQRKYKGSYRHRMVQFFSKLPLKTHLKTFILSTARYVIFSFQYYFLLRVFGVEMGYFVAMMFITTMYLIASIIPSISLFDWAIKGSVAVWVFGFYQVDDLIVICISLFMWTLNFALPALFGSYYVLSFKWPWAYPAKISEL